MRFDIKNHNSSGRAFLATILFVLLITVSASFFTYNFRVVKTFSGFHVVEKSDPAFDAPYVDITGWGVKELFVFHDITYEVINAGYVSEIPQVAMFNHAVDQGVSSIQEFDERYGVSQGVSDWYDWTVEQMREMDRQYEIQQKVDAVVDEAKRIDEEYGISESLKEGMDKASEAAKEIWEKVKERN